MTTLHQWIDFVQQVFPNGAIGSGLIIGFVYTLVSVIILRRAGIFLGILFGFGLGSICYEANINSLNLQISLFFVALGVMMFMVQVFMTLFLLAMEGE